MEKCSFSNKQLLMHFWLGLPLLTIIFVVLLYYNKRIVVWQVLPSAFGIWYSRWWTTFEGLSFSLDFLCCCVLMIFWPLSAYYSSAEMHRNLIKMHLIQHQKKSWKISKKSGFFILHLLLFFRHSFLIMKGLDNQMVYRGAKRTCITCANEQ